MKVKRIFAPDMKNAMRRVREEIGPDAVILSNKRVAGGVEVVASPEAEYETAQARLSQERQIKRAEQIALLTGVQGESRKALDEELARARARIGEARMRTDIPESSSSANRQLKDNGKDIDRLLAQEWDDYPVSVNRSSERSQVDPAIAGLQSEIDQLKSMLQAQLQGQQMGHAATPAVRTAKRTPAEAPLHFDDNQTARGANKVQRQVFKHLTKLGVGEALAQGLVTGVEASLPVDRAWRNVLARLSDSLPVFGEDLIDRGGMIALVGPTGAGKTTTIGKLATRYVLEHGNKGIALVTTDSYRIAAHEQIKTFGRILDVPVRVVDENNPLEEVLLSLRSKRLVLIDTAGMNTRDPAGQEQFEMLANAGVRMKRLLVLASSSQRLLMEQAYASYEPLGLTGLVLTKVDEAGSLGEALALSIEKQLRVAYVSEGQRVPDDLEVARRKDLISRAVVLMQQSHKLSQQQSSEMPILAALRTKG